jgi:hypothetical protein
MSQIKRLGGLTPHAGLISEVGMPSLDGSSKDAAYIKSATSGEAAEQMGIASGETRNAEGSPVVVDRDLNQPVMAMEAKRILDLDANLLRNTLQKKLSDQAEKSEK